MKTYQDLRPNEDPTILYQRILKCAHHTLVSDVEPIPPQTVNNILAYLKSVCIDLNIKSKNFSDALKSILIVMMLRWTITAHPQDAKLDNIKNIKGSIPGADVNIARYCIFMINGFAIKKLAENSSTWTLRKNDTDFTYDAARQDTLVDVDPVWKTLKSNYSNFQIEKEYLKDYAYFIHCMQKPAFEVPNPVILGTFLGELAAPQSVGTDAEGSEILDRNRQHDFAYQLVHYYDDDSDFTIQKAAMKKLIQGLFSMYQHGAGYLWTSNNKIPAATYMQNSTTEIPSLAYHGNLVIDRQNIGREEVRCVGHLGNSFPGCSCIRQGKGMLNLYERPPTAIHVI